MFSRRMVNHYLCLLAMVFAAVVVSVFLPVVQSAHASVYDRESVSLNGVWDFYPNSGATRYDISVPSYWDGTDYFGNPSSWLNLSSGKYKRNFTVPTSMAGKQIFLNFQQLGPLAKVTVNGTLISTNTNNYLMGHLEYNLDITSLANVGGTNTLEVNVWDLAGFPADAKDASNLPLYPIGLDNFNWGQGRGIYDDVALIAKPKVNISDTYIVTDLKNNTDPTDDVITVNVQ
jgi:beta-galactosidase/beta-glucuronidase